ncbi:autophagy associated protein kinase activator Atg17 [Schizosaccharomyces japonicus yFS275]|uniref:Autophagy-related protein 17 n=1 Tax=Schizosaccharomyces japonicus (strain yFS275 / FY16936) TaxID=402676 RepID=B6K8D9_SCHJY|nr:autophagy associated protein kinase activator Atg17 [Schizosaccharomyces japonicus yFS275]EEB09793.1 autophagy associated protein kinase activator Atg17 [Schizosaccharomyces japonicus yFS275]
MDQLSEWAIQAKNALSQAQQYCEAAHRIDEEAMNMLQHYQKQHERLKELSKLTASQCSRLDASTALIQQLLSLVQKHPTFNQLSQLHEQLEAALKRLRETSVDLAFGCNHDNLYAFVDDTALEDLKTRLRCVTDSVWNAYERLVGLLDEGLCSQYRTRLLNTNLEFAVPTNNSVAEELADLLFQVAQHYEQCTKAVEIYSTLDEAASRELVEVLREDSEHLPVVLAQLKSGLDSTRAFQQSVNDYSSNIQAASVQLEPLAEELNKNELTNQRHEAAHELIKAQTGIEIPQLAQELIQLRNHYTQFAKTYNSLLDEVRRRRAYETRMRGLVRDFVTKLEKEQSGESEARVAFLNRHGDFLPQTLWPAVTDPPLHFEITEHQYSELPDIEDRSTKH